MAFTSILMTKLEPINIKDTCAFKIIYFRQFKSLDQNMLQDCLG